MTPGAEADTMAAGPCDDVTFSEAVRQLRVQCSEFASVLSRLGFDNPFLTVAA